MNFRSFLAPILLLFAMSAGAADELTSLHPEEAYPDSTEHGSLGPYTEFTKQVQQKLHEHRFNPGPVNGDLNSKTHAGRAQIPPFGSLPASGMLDDQTVAALGLERDQNASAGASSDQAE